MVKILDYLQRRRVRKYYEKFLSSLVNDLFPCERNLCSLIKRKKFWGESVYQYQYEDNTHLCFCVRNKSDKLLHRLPLLVASDVEIKKKSSVETKKKGSDFLWYWVTRTHLKEELDEETMVLALDSILAIQKKFESEKELAKSVVKRAEIGGYAVKPEIDRIFRKVKGTKKKLEVSDIEMLLQKLDESPTYREFADKTVDYAKEKAKEVIERNTYIISTHFITTYTPEKFKTLKREFKEIARSL